MTDKELKEVIGFIVAGVVFIGVYIVAWRSIHPNPYGGIVWVIGVAFGGGGVIGLLRLMLKGAK
jgi:hypothetical protein